MQNANCLVSPFGWALRISVAVVVCFLFVSVALAQGVGGKISGRATDPSGAVIPGVRIAAQNVNTNVVSETQTDASGYYTLQLPSGDYTVTVGATGFATMEQKNVAVTVGGDMGVDFHLQVASTATVVEVHGEASAQLISPTSSEVQTTVNNTLVSTIPVEASGALRTADSFLKLEPGYNGSTLNGGNGGQVVTVDGADVSAVGFGSGSEGIQYASPVPSFAVQEFQVVGSNADADVGRTSTGAVSFALKSGTNKLHGSAFLYNRNTIYDAKTYFQPTRGVDRQNEFGFDIGGPIKRDKTFFYGYYDGFRYTTTNTGVVYSLLSQAMKGGDFTAAGIPAIYDPATTAPNGSGGFTRQQFSCNGVLNKICPDRISKVSAYFLSLLPNPTLPGLTNNFVGTTQSITNSDQYLIKIDHTFSSSSRLSGSYNWMRNPQFSTCTFGLNICGSSNPHHGYRSIINWNKTLSANKVNHFHVSYNTLFFFSHSGGQNSYTNGSNLNGNAGLGFVNQTGFAHIGVAGGYYLGAGSNINKIDHQVYTLSDDFTWVRGSHEMEFGTNLTRYYTIGVQGAYCSTNWGNFQFSPLETNLPTNSKTGYAPASYLLGEVDNAGFCQNPAQAMVMPYYGFYGQDKWKIHSNLTLTYGLRWDYNSPPTDRANHIANFDPTVPNTAAGNVLGTLVFAGTGAGKSGKHQFANPYYAGIGPRVGIAYAWKPGTVFRAAWGLMFDTNSGYSVHLNQQGYFTSALVASLNGGVTSAFNWNTGFPIVPLGPDLDPTFANGASTSWVAPYGARLPEVINYNIGVQQRIWGGIVIDASYVGTQSHHMYDGTNNANQLDPKYLSLGTLLQANVGSAQANAAGITKPYPTFTGTVAQALRPYPQYQAITNLNDSIGNQHYNALQIRAQKSLSQGISILAAFSYEKNITDVGTAQNYYDRKPEATVASSDLPRKFTAGYTYELPIGAGKRLGLRNELANRFLGGWTTSGVITLQSGAPIAVTTEGSLPAMGAVRPNVVVGQNPYGPNDSRGAFNPATDKYLSIGAFALPAAFTFGNAPPRFDTIRSFGMKNWDVALMKRFPITERLSLSLKGEFFNVLNEVNFGSPNADIQSASFGKITTINGSPRTGQLSGTFAW